ncbi:MBL fold metallo-hydrolase [Mariniflexile sp. AS56]|uniref:MBL fold metallo-hydrolase n=1 Tax=Mariniflexile sp. AS56 TaxID=3063957 RepID=UPI0026EA6601|nr:MBL fold metallo-hydrolase [Mariniflexile sp. AS56]MDO7173722.1 MBL fold metallo-hydrolase [Mariniflexile sp. AS56]
MKLQLIRNATLKLSYAGKTILVDPMFCEKDFFNPFLEGLEKNPTCDLKIPVGEIMKGIDSVLVTHSHPDHLDAIAAETLPKSIKMFGAPVDTDFIKNFGFTNVEIINENTTWNGITITRVKAQHGSGPVLQYMVDVSGFVLQADNEPTVYIVSDSILTNSVIQTIQRFKPDIIVTNSGGGIIPGYESTPVIMDEEQTIEVCNISPNSKIIAVHLECIDFCRVTRISLRNYANANGISNEQLLIPNDGEALVI